ncbi:MAG: DUF2085 domain-containing protein [Chloroflexota bacterium]
MLRVAIERWLFLANAAVAVFVALPLAAPVLAYAGWLNAANVIYVAYRSVCHQWAFRSYFLFGQSWTYTADTMSSLAAEADVFATRAHPLLGYKVAFCERDTAIYAAVLLAGLLYAIARRRAAPLSLGAYSLLILPMALDGFSQLLGWRESSPELRTITGALFGAASAWLIYPRLDLVAGQQSRPTAPRRSIHVSSAAP